MAWREAVVKRSFTPKVSKRAVYCFTREFLGSVRMETSWGRLNGVRETVMGIRPRSSGMRP